MLREEAILHMTLRREELKHSVGDLDEDIKAFDMAIQALEQTELKPSYNSVKTELNLISRQAVLEKAYKIAGYDRNAYVVDVADIEALPSVKPCEDAISRQAAIEAVKKNTFRLTFAEEQNCEGHVAWSANAVYSDEIEGALLELPSLQPKIKKDGDTISRQTVKEQMIKYGFHAPDMTVTEFVEDLPSVSTENPNKSEIKQKCDRINSLASVLPYAPHREIQELLCEIMDMSYVSTEKTGYWRPVYQGDEIIDYRCSECEFGSTFGKSTHGMNFCPNCGCRMMEVEE